MRAVVTGAGGLLARALLPALESAGHPALALTRRDADVTRLESLCQPLRAFRPDWLFHLAAYTRVDDAETHADQAYLVNALGARNAALAAAEAGAAVLLVSTDYVFDGRASRPYREYDTPAPLSAYGASKLAGERAVREVNGRHLIVRTSWLYGRGGACFPDTILRRAREGAPLRVVDDQRGSPTWTADLATALVRLAAAAEFGTYHCTGSGDCSWHEFASHLVERSGLRARLEPIASAASGRAAARPAYSVLSNLLYEHVTGHRMPPWKESADRYLESLREHGASPRQGASR
jgi:dTDP-4-dehydrorhamnose reductase